MASIEKRGQNSWRLVVEGGLDAHGKRIKHSKTIRVEDETILNSKRRLPEYLNMQLLIFKQEVESGNYVKPEKTTFKEFLTVWIKNYAEQNLGAYTRRNTVHMIEKHLLPVFGHMELNKIRTMHIVAFLTQLRSPESRKDGKNKPLSASYQLNIFKALKSILDAAYKWKIIAVNPMDGVDRPVANKAEKRDIRSRKHNYTQDETDQLIKALYDEPRHWRIYFLGLVLGGFRRGELLGVEWPAVDFEQGGLHIEKQISLDENNQAIEAPLKTETSEGFVTMPRWYMNELAQYRKEWLAEKMKQGIAWTGGDKQFVFHAGHGQMMYPTSPTWRWKKFIEKHDLPKIRLHDLRHTAAMILREDGVDLKAIQERLRHSKLAVTADFYTHASSDINRVAADHLEKFDPKRSAK